MTTPGIDSIGYCVNYTEQGDWAFELALGISRRYRLQLNIFHFLSDPYDRYATTSPNLSKEHRTKLSIDLERQMRLYYEDRLGDYLDVGFRLCEDNEWTELHRCLSKREFQLLVLAMPDMGATFGRRDLVEFAQGFVCPVALVGPSKPTEISLNDPARLISYRVGIDQMATEFVSQPSAH